MTDPETNQLVSSADEIKRVSLTYCTNLLTNRPAKEDYKEDLDMKNQLHDVHMDEIIDDDIQELSLEQFRVTIGSLIEKKSSKYEFILRDGPSVREAIFHLFGIQSRFLQAGINLDLSNNSREKEKGQCLTTIGTYI